MRSRVVLAVFCLLVATAASWFAFQSGGEPWPELGQMKAATGQSLRYAKIHHDVTRYIIDFKFQANDKHVYEGSSICFTPVERGQPMIVFYDPEAPGRFRWASSSELEIARDEYA